MPNYCRKRDFVSELLSKKTTVMATISLAVVPGKALKDGKHKVRVAVAHNSQTRYIVTDVTLDSIKEWKNGKVVKRDDASYLNIKLLKLMQDIQRAIDDTPYIEGLSCSELVEAVMQTRRHRSLTLRAVFDELMEVSSAAASTKTLYGSYFRMLTSVIPEQTLITNVTPVMVRRFVKAKEGRISQVYINSILTFLSQMFTHSQRNGYTDFRIKPTDGLVRKVVSVRQNWLTPDEIRHVRDFKCKYKGFDRFRDIFMLSYYLGGINIVDLFKINFDECGRKIKYVRTKTRRVVKVNAFVEFDIPDEAWEIIKRHKGADGRLKTYTSGNGRQCLSSSIAAERYRGLLGLPQLTFYSARKSFAQHAFSLGVSESVIDFVLGHSLGSGGHGMLYSYVKVTPEMATECVRKVCDFIASSENFL